MRNCSLQVLYVSDRNIGNDGIAAFMRTLCTSHIIELHFFKCNISPTGAMALAEGLLVNNSIRVLSIAENDIGNIGITAIAAGLHRVQINELHLRKCGITADGAKSLGDTLINSRIKVLSIPDNLIGDDGITAIVRALNRIEVTELYIGWCGISVLGAILLGECLINSSIKTLSMPENNIGDCGIAAIAGALAYSQIHELCVQSCGITDVGVRSLGEALLVNNSIRILYIQYNPITIKGARLLLQLAVLNEFCYNVRVGSQYDNDNFVKTIMEIFRGRQEQSCKEIKDVRSCSFTEVENWGNTEEVESI